MLKGLHRLLDAEVLGVLAAMGHGDELAIVDANFPAAALARRNVHVGGADVVTVARAVLSVLPLDTVVDCPLAWMASAPGAPPTPVQEEVRSLCSAIEQRDVPVLPLERHAFYARARDAFAVLSTADLRPYSCFMLTKGVVLDDGTP